MHSKNPLLDGEKCRSRVEIPIGELLIWSQMAVQNIKERKKPTTPKAKKSLQGMRYFFGGYVSNHFEEAREKHVSCPAHRDINS